MNRGGDELIGWCIDGLAASLLGAAIGACLLLLGYPAQAVGVAAAGGVVTLGALRLVKPEPRRFRIPAFALVPADYAAEPDILELTDIAAAEPLELEDVLPAPAEDSRVVQLFAARPLPTPGELARRIDRHLEEGEEGRGGRTLELEVDAAAALRHALGELRRSLA